MFQLLVLPTVRGLKVHRELGWDRTWTADPYESKEYSITYSETLNNKTGGAGQDEGCYCSGTSSVVHQSVGSEKLLLLILFFFFFFLFFVLVLSTHRFLNFSIFSPSYYVQGGWTNGHWCLAASAGLNFNISPVIIHGIFCPQKISVHLTGPNYTMHTHTA